MWTLVVYMFWSASVTSVAVPGYGSEGLCDLAGSNVAKTITKSGGTAFYVCIEVLK